MKTGGGNEQEWVKTQEARKLFEQEKSYVSEQRIYSRQAQELKILPGQKQKNMGRAFMQLFKTSPVAVVLVQEWAVETQVCNPTSGKL